MKKGFLILLLLLLMPVLANAAGSAVVDSGAAFEFTHTHHTAIDSARAYFGSPDSTNYYDSLKIVPPTGYDSLVAIGTFAGLDSLGLNIVMVKVYEKGAVAISARVFSDIYVQNTNAKLNVITAELDTSMWLMTARIGSQSHTNYGTTIDTIYAVSTAGDTVGFYEYYFTGANRRPTNVTITRF